MGSYGPQRTLYISFQSAQAHAMRPLLRPIHLPVPLSRCLLTQVSGTRASLVPIYEPIEQKIREVALTIVSQKPKRKMLKLGVWLLVKFYHHRLEFPCSPPHISSGMRSESRAGRLYSRHPRGRAVLHKCRHSRIAHKAERTTTRQLDLSEEGVDNHCCWTLLIRDCGRQTRRWLNTTLPFFCYRQPGTVCFATRNTAFCPIFVVLASTWPDDTLVNNNTVGKHPKENNSRLGTGTTRSRPPSCFRPPSPSPTRLFLCDTSYASRLASTRIFLRHYRHRIRVFILRNI